MEKYEDLEGFTDWSVEAGILHVQPPPAVIKELLTVLIHFDACDSSNGAINVVPGSHKFGPIPPEATKAMTEHCSFSCAVGKNGVMFMKPMILHDSPKTNNELSRRVLQIEYGYKLERGLQWHGLPESSTNGMPGRPLAELRNQ